MKNLQEFAETVASDVNKNYSIDPFTIIAIINITIQIAKIIYECRKKPESIIEIARNRPIIESIWLRRKIRSCLLKEQRHRDNDLSNAIYAGINQLNKDELDNLIQEAIKQGA
jgi:hypothetical protein